jgi:hypothetical protein
MKEEGPLTLEQTAYAFDYAATAGLLPTKYPKSTNNEGYKAYLTKHRVASDRTGDDGEWTHSIETSTGVDLRQDVGVQELQKKGHMTLMGISGTTSDAVNVLKYASLQNGEGSWAPKTLSADEALLATFKLSQLFMQRQVATIGLGIKLNEERMKAGYAPMQARAFGHMGGEIWLGLHATVRGFDNKDRPRIAEEVQRYSDFLNGYDHKVPQRVVASYDWSEQIRHGLAFRQSGPDLHGAF